MGPASSNVALNIVVAVDQPVDGRRRIRSEADEVLARIRAEVASDHILGLEAILHKVDVPSRLEGDVVLHP